MKKKLPFLFFLSITLFLLLLQIGCIHDSVEMEQKSVQNDPLSYIQNQYLKDKSMVLGKDIRWESVRLYKDKDSIILITVPIKNTENNLIEELSFRIDHGKVAGHLWRYESQKPFSVGDYKLSGHEIMNKMDGKVSYTSLEGNFSYKLRMIAGTSIQDTRMSSIDNVMALGGDDPLCGGRCHQEIPGVDIPGRPKPDPLFPPEPDPVRPPGTMPLPNFPTRPPVDPCISMKTQRESKEFKDNLKDLKGKTGLKKETGYTQHARTGEYTYVDAAATNETSNSLSLPDAKKYNIKSYMHTHVDNYTDEDGIERIGIKMFSPADVIYLMDMLQNAKDRSISFSEVSGTMVTSTGTYTIRFTGNEYQIKSFTDEQRNKFRDSYTDFMNSNPTLSLEQKFLQFIDTKMNIKGVELFKLNEDGSNTKTILNSDKSSISTSNCPN